MRISFVVAWFAAMATMAFFSVCGQAATVKWLQMAASLVAPVFCCTLVFGWLIAFIVKAVHE